LLHAIACEQMGWLILVARQRRKNFLNMQNDQRAGGLTSYHTSNFSLEQVNNKDIYIGERQRLLVSTKSNLCQILNVQT
jgi:hypothetical protein